jgi:hypothetical protein
VFFNFEGLQRKYNLTHFPPLAGVDIQEAAQREEDYAARPDLKKAAEIARAMAPELVADNALSVALYFHLEPCHLQSAREALQVRQATSCSLLMRDVISSGRTLLILNLSYRHTHSCRADGRHDLAA